MSVPARRQHLPRPDIESLSPSQIMEGVTTNGFSPEEATALFSLRDPDEPFIGAIEPLTPKQRLQQRQQRMMAVFKTERKPLIDTAYLRIPYAWRIVRGLMVCSGRWKPGTPLSELMVPSETNMDPWMYPDDPRKAKPLVARPPAVWAKALVESDRLDDKWQVSIATTKGHIPVRGLPYLPPRVPQGAKDSGGLILPGYDPRDRSRDPLLHLWCESVASVIRAMGIDRGPGSSEGLYGMDDPLLCRYAWPTWREIEEWEASVIEYAQERMDKGDSFFSGSRKLASESVRDKYGLSREESDDICRAATMGTLTYYERDKDIQRALMSRRLEAIADRSRISGDTRSELMAIKTLCTVAGLGIHQEKDDGKWEVPEGDIDYGKDAEYEALPPHDGPPTD